MGLTPTAALKIPSLPLLALWDLRQWNEGTGGRTDVNAAQNEAQVVQ